MKNLIRIVIIISTMLLLAACGGKKNTGSGSVDSSGHITLEFWYSLGGDAGTAVTDMVDAFNESQSDITVIATYQGNYAATQAKVFSAITGETVPNVVQVGAAPLLGMSGAIHPISYFADKDPAFDMSSIRPAFLEYNMANGVLWSLPFNNSVPLLYYNKDLFIEAGLDPDNPPQSLDELLEVAQALKIGSDIGEQTGKWALNATDNTQWYLSTMILQNGGKIVSEDESEVLYNSPEAVEMLQLWSDWAHIYKIMPADQHAEALTDFLSGKLGMLFGSSSRVRSMEPQANFSLGTAVFPSVDGVRHIPLGGGSLAIFKNSDERLEDASWEFVKFMMSKENSQYLLSKTGYIPIYADAFEWPEVQQLIAESPIFEAPIESLPHVMCIPVFSALGNSDLAMRNAIQKIEHQTATPQQALDAAKSSVDHAIKTQFSVED